MVTFSRQLIVSSLLQAMMALLLVQGCRLIPSSPPPAPAIPSPDVQMSDAIDADDLPQVQALLKKGVSPNQKPQGVHSTFMELAIRKKRLDIVKLFVTQPGVTIDGPDGKWGLIHEAASSEDIEITRLLLKHGARVNARDQIGRTPLHCCVDRIMRIPPNCAAMATFLLDQGAKVNAVDNEGATPLLQACSYTDGGSDVAQVLLAHSARLNLANKNGLTPLDCAKGFGNAEMEKLLLEALKKKKP
jgi:uncharacterized protein